MNRVLALAIMLALSAGAADAKACRDARGKFTKCPPASSSLAVNKRGDVLAINPRGDTLAIKSPVCKVGKPCGKSCISKDKVCHK